MKKKIFRFCNSTILKIANCIIKIISVEKIFYLFLKNFKTYFQETYPNTPPVWFSESDEANIANALTSLSETNGLENHLLHQIRLLLRELCTLYALPLLPECTEIPVYNTATGTSVGAAHGSTRTSSRGGNSTNASTSPASSSRYANKNTCLECIN